jgi:hypothetical protein
MVLFDTAHDDEAHNEDTAHEYLPAASGIGGSGALMVCHSCRIVDDALSARMGDRPMSATLLLEDEDDEGARAAHDEFLPAATEIGRTLVGRHSLFPPQI